MRTLHRLINGRDIEAWHAARVPLWGKRVCALSCKKSGPLSRFAPALLLARPGTYCSLTITGSVSLPAKRYGSTLSACQLLSLCLFVARLERPLVDLHGLSFALPLRNGPPRREKRPHISHLTIAVDCLAARPPGREDHCRCDPNPKLTDNPQRP